MNVLMFLIHHNCLNRFTRVIALRRICALLTEKCRDQPGARTLTTAMAVAGGGSAMSVEACTSACQAANYIYAGVEYGVECCTVSHVSQISFSNRCALI